MAYVRLLAMATGWTASDIPDLTGTRAVITGANSGIGYEAAARLAEHGAAVTLAVRDTERGGEAATRITARMPGAEVTVGRLDLADLASVRDFAGSWDGGLDLLINNAGVMAPPRRTTRDGFELQLGTNHLGHFALTGLLLPALIGRRDPRVVTVSSQAAMSGKIDFDDLDGERSYGRWRAYGQSKLANLLFTLELDRRLSAAGAHVLAAACHPGYASTSLQATTAQASGNPVEKVLASLANTLVGQSPAAGALPTEYAATAPDVVGGRYYGPQGLFGARGLPGPAALPKQALDTAAAGRLWDVSVHRTGVAFEALNVGA